MVDKHSSTVALLNAQATCYMRMGKFEDADSALQEALDRVIFFFSLPIFSFS